MMTETIKLLGWILILICNTWEQRYKAVVVIVLCSILMGCRTTQQSTSHISVSDSIRTESSIIKEKEDVDKSEHIRDTIVDVRPSSQTSLIVGIDSSRLETDYSISEAKIDSSGKLWHRMWNKKSFQVTVPGGVKETNTTIHIEKETMSELFEQKTETSEITQKEVVIESRWLDWFFYPFGVTVFALIIIYLILLLWKKKLKSMLKLILA